MYLKIKPFSVNDAWKGRRFRTDEYKRYSEEVLLRLRPAQIPEGYLGIHLIWGFSSGGSDFDNPIKPFVDCLQKKYGFNDNRIKKASEDVVDVKKGEEFIEFELYQCERFKGKRGYFYARSREGREDDNHNNGGKYERR